MKKVHEHDTVGHFKSSNVKSGKDGKGGKVTNRKQAIAIGISEAKEAGLKVPVQKDKQVSQNILIDKGAAF